MVNLLGQAIVILERSEHFESNPDGQVASKEMHNFRSATEGIQRMVSPCFLHTAELTPPTRELNSAGFKILSFRFFSFIRIKLKLFVIKKVLEMYIFFC